MVFPNLKFLSKTPLKISKHMTSTNTKTEYLKARSFVNKAWEVGRWLKPSQLSKEKRINPELLELAYKSVPFLNRAINLKAMHTISPWFVFGDDKQDELFSNWTKANNYKQKLYSILITKCIFGYAFAEIIKNRKGDIADISLIDPKSIMVKINQDGEITDYGQALPNETEPSITFKPEEIILFNGTTLAGDLFGIGDVEPIYSTLETWLNTQDGIANYMYRHGFPKYHVSIKGENVSDDVLTDVRNEFQTMSNKNEFITRGEIEIKSIDTSESRVDVVGYQNMGIDLLCSSLGIPKLLMGLGADVNRATGSLMLDSWDRENQLMHLQIDEVMRPLYIGILGTEDYEIVWGEWNAEDVNMKSTRLLSELNSGAITVNEYRTEMGYEEIDESELPQPQPNPEMPDIGELSKNLQQLISDGIDEAELELNLNIRQNLELKSMRDHIIEALIKYGFEEAKLTKKQKEAAKEILKSNYLEGGTYGDMIEELIERLKIQKFEARRLVITEMNKAKNTGKLYSYKESGVVKGKRWRATLDNKTSDICKKLNGQIKKLDEDFAVNGNKLNSPPSHPNCRCSIQAVV